MNVRELRVELAADPGRYIVHLRQHGDEFMEFPLTASAVVEDQRTGELAAVWPTSGEVLKVCKELGVQLGGGAGLEARRRCCILNAGPGARAYDRLAEQLSAALWIDVSETPRECNFVLCADGLDPAILGESFIPLESVRIVSDKRLLFARLAENRILFSHITENWVSTIKTRLVDSLAEAKRLLEDEPGIEWCVRHPLDGKAERRQLTADLTLPANWPTPLLVQVIVRMARPEVYRAYYCGRYDSLWVVRRCPDGVSPSRWIPRGSRYEPVGEAPDSAKHAVFSTMIKLDLRDRFGCVDLVLLSTGEWVVLDVETYGSPGHVDCDLNLPVVELELHRQLAGAFWRRFGGNYPGWESGSRSKIIFSWPCQPWSQGEWRPRPQ